MYEIALIILLTTSDGGAQIKYIPMIKTQYSSIFNIQKQSILNNCRKLGKTITHSIPGRYLHHTYRCTVLNGE